MDAFGFSFDTDCADAGEMVEHSPKQRAPNTSKRFIPMDLVMADQQRGGQYVVALHNI